MRMDAVRSLGRTKFLWKFLMHNLQKFELQKTGQIQIPSLPRRVDCDTRRERSAHCSSCTYYLYCIACACNHTMCDPLYSLPCEIFSYILSYLTPSELGKCALLSSIWNEAANSSYVCTRVERDQRTGEGEMTEFVLTSRRCGT